MEKPTAQAVNFLSLDLEMAQPSRKIIQIGAVVGNLYTGEIRKRAGWFVKIDEPLTPFITQLTGITDNDLACGHSLTGAAIDLFCMAKEDNCMVNPLTWGGGDSQELYRQLSQEYFDWASYPWPFGRRWLDVKTLFQMRQLARGEKIQAGLAKALTKCGLKFKGQKHNAIDDALNTFYLAHYLVKEMKK